MTTDLPPDLHSAAYFGDQRDFWWNADHVALFVARLGLAGARSVLDAGCGVGHWGRVLLPHLPEAALTGVDREPAWVAEAAARAAAAGFGARATYRVGDVNALPFADGAFDLVTCQTVLIHVADVRAVLREFMRVLRPGGALLVAEPNNLSNGVATGSAGAAEPLEERLALVRLQMLCERGKAALGEGDNSVGELVPGFAAEVGYEGVACWMSDRTQTLVPPYAAPDQRAFRADVIEMHERGWWWWSPEDTRRYYLAGGGAEGDFERAWERARAAQGRVVEALRAGTFHGAGGGIQYVVAGRRPG